VTESELQALILRAAGSKPHVRVFRNQVGEGYVGKALRDPEGVFLMDARHVRMGLFPGSGDLIGWRTLTITPDMVGQPIAQFLSIEVKTPTGKVRPDQRNWADQITAAGGLAIIARSVSDTDNL
jgi:hypothetical protein